MWCESTKYSRVHVHGTILCLRNSVPEGLDSVTVEQIKKNFSTCRDSERAYREGGAGKEVEERVQVFTQKNDHVRPVSCLPPSSPAEFCALALFLPV